MYFFHTSLIWDILFFISVPQGSILGPVEYSIFKLHLRDFLLLKVSNTFHYWPLCDFDHI